MSTRERRFSKSRRVALAGGAAVLLGSAGVTAARAANPFAVGFESEQAPDHTEDVLFIAEGPEPTKLKEHRERWLKAVADKLGVTPERLDQALNDVAKDQGLPPPLAIGPLGIGKPPAPGEAFTLKLDPGLTAAAKALGMTEDELRKEWPAKSLNDIARARNVDPKVVADAIKAQRRADIDKAVAENKLPQTAADKLKAHLDFEVEMMMQRGGFPRKPGAGLPLFHIERVIRPD